MRVGIPRVLSAYYYLPLYKTFLEQMGCETLVSSPTGGKTMEGLVYCPTDEPCISVKLAFPHTVELLEKGIDRLFFPTLIGTVRNRFYCPKHIGVPAMLRNGLGLSEDFLISPPVAGRRRPEERFNSFLAAGRKLGASSRECRRALKEAWKAQELFWQATVQQRMTSAEALEELFQVPLFRRRRRYNPLARQREELRVGVVGHSYILYDYIGHNVVERLQEQATVLVPEMVPQETIARTLGRLPYGEELWRFEQLIIGSAFHWLESGAVDCLVLVSPFECGPEAVMEVFLEEAANAAGIPLLVLTVDEQTGEAGVVTRLEAFLDTVKAGRGSRYFPQAERKPKRPAAPPERVIGFPTFGTLDLVLPGFFEQAGVKTVGPVSLSRRTLELGEELAPEFICHPFALTLGQMRQCLEAGANTLLMVGGKGRCRLGWYAEMQEILLKKAGYSFEMITLHSPLPLKKNWRSFLERLRPVIGPGKGPRLLADLYAAFLKAHYLDLGEELLFYWRAREKERGSADALYGEFCRRLKEARRPGTVRRLYAAFRESCARLERAPGPEPLRVRLVGEIYAVYEDFVNGNLAKALGSLEGIRIEVRKEITAMKWLRENLLRSPGGDWRHYRVKKAAAPYLKELVGGHGLESIGLAALASREGFDGVVHLWPFTCMPEIIAQNIMTRISRETDLPVLTVIVNEQSGSAGLQTRLESFAHVLQERRERKGEKGRCPVSWDWTWEA